MTSTPRIDLTLSDARVRTTMKDTARVILEDVEARELSHYMPAIADLAAGADAPALVLKVNELLEALRQAGLMEESLPG